MRIDKSKAVVPSRQGLRQRVQQQRGMILKFDATVGVFYSALFLIAPGRTLSTFFEYNFDDSIVPFLHVAVRVIGVNRLGYVRGWLTDDAKRKGNSHCHCIYDRWRMCHCLLRTSAVGCVMDVPFVHYTHYAYDIGPCGAGPLTKYIEL